MKCELTGEQIVAYRDNGFMMIRDFLSPEELARWRSAFDEAVEARGDYTLPGERRHDREAGRTVFVQRLNLWLSSRTVRSLILDPGIGRLACDLEGIDSVRVWHDQALIKPPWANATTWHVDNPYFSFSSRQCTTIWVALDDVTMQNGCLYFLPGTHKRATFEPAGFGPNMADLFKIYPDWATIAPVACEMPAGSCTFHNGLTAHAAGPNMTIGRRRAMTCAFMPDGSTFNGTKNILSDEQVARLKVGDVLDDAAQNPIVYSRDPSRMGSEERS